jgi:hypothetical protein
MAIIEGRTGSLAEAVKIAIMEAQATDMNPDITQLFGTVLDRKADREQMREITIGSLRKQYGKGVRWRVDDWWLIAVPLPLYEARGVPCLVVETSSWLVVSARVTPEWSKESRDATIVSPWGKPVKTVLPLSFLESLLDGTEDRYRIVGKDGAWTLLEVAGLKQPLRLNDDFIEGLKDVLDIKPLADWLDDFGKRGRTLCPLVVGTMLGLIYRDKNALLPIEEQPLDIETLTAAANSLGYSTARVEKAIERAGTELRPEMSIKEALPILLRYVE